MYAIRNHGETCQILDADQQVRFTGNLAECEDWLDRQENAQPASRAATSPIRTRSTLLQRWRSLAVRRLPRTE